MMRVLLAMFIAALAVWACASSLMGAVRALLDNAPGEMLGLLVAALCCIGVLAGSVVFAMPMEDET
jgi:small basic protein